MAYPTRHIFYSINPGPPVNDSYLTWLEFILRQLIVPQTINLSYSNTEKSLSEEYAGRVCLLLGALGLRGVSILVASGDSGVGPGNCDDGSGNVKFIPFFPGTCTCGPFYFWPASTTRTYKSLTTWPHFLRSLGHYRWRNDGLFARGRGEPLRRRLLGLLCAPRLPAAGRVRLPPGPELRRPVSALVQVGLHP
jgi:hypothetical protein